jgi:uncharacterized integral membrane protein
MIRVVILLLIVAGLVIFALQNLAPIPLVVLGIRLTLPLAAWVLGAMAAGALTTLLLSGFSSLSRSAAVRRSTQSGATRSPWSSTSPRDSGAARPRNPTGSNTADRRSTDDWETTAKDEWDEWVEDSPPRRSASTPKTEVRDTAAEKWAAEETYQERRPRWSPWSLGDEPRPQSSRRYPDSYEDAPRDSVRRSPIDPPVQPHRTEFETPQSPTTQQQTGSVYSYSYREPQDSPVRKPNEVRKTNEVYDAEFRVLIPPYNPAAPSAPEPPTPPPAAEDDDDWGLDDDLEEKPKP